MKTLLIPLFDNEGQTGRLSAAIELTETLRARLVCTDIALHYAAAEQQQRSDDDWPSADYQDGLLTKPPAWLDEIDDMASVIAEHAGLADLVILSLQLPDDARPDMTALLRALLAKGRTPILALPPTSTGFTAAGSAIVLWDGSADAETALRAAVPLLSHARMVTILHVMDGSLLSPIRLASDYLRSHGIATHAIGWDVFDTTPLTIERYIARHRPAYVVLGACGRSAGHDLEFGQVTRHLLRASPAPLLLAGCR